MHHDALMTNEEKLVARWLVHCIEIRRTLPLRQRVHHKPSVDGGYAVFRFNHDHTMIRCVVGGCDWQYTLEPLPAVLPFALVPGDDSPE